MDKPIVLPLMKKYVDTIHDPGAERRFAMLAKGYKEALQEGERNIDSQRVIKGALETVTGKPASHVTSEEDQFMAIVNEYEQKARDLAAEYIKDPQVLSDIDRAVNEETGRSPDTRKSEKDKLLDRMKEARQSKTKDQEY